MTNKSSRGRGNVRRRISPTQQAQPRRVAPKVAFNGMVLSGTNFPTAITSTVTSGVAFNMYPVDCTVTASGVAGSGVLISSALGTALGSIANNYQEYKYRSIKFQWLPSLGPNSTAANTRVYAAIIDNPEEMVTYGVGSDTTGISRLKGVGSVKFFNAWERQTLVFNIPTRRKLFDVNATIDFSNPDIVSRSTQAMVVTGFEGAPTTATELGRWIITSSLEVRGLSTNLGT